MGNHPKSVTSEIVSPYGGLGIGIGFLMLAKNGHHASLARVNHLEMNIIGRSG
jgi:hypothetical protein